nr:MAG TPA: hypothetical protein [Bacteriophage sp.]DAX07242.1 MAG TPA: hypothetical protein [Bacteriophage sp.]
MLLHLPFRCYTTNVQNSGKADDQEYGRCSVLIENNIL